MGSDSPVRGRALVFLPHAGRDMTTDSTGAFLAEEAPRGLVELAVRWGGMQDGWLGYRGCEMEILVDGMSIGDTPLDRIDPDRIAAMEVFTGAWHEMPPGYDCGVILLWQKKGGGE